MSNSLDIFLVDPVGAERADPRLKIITADMLNDTTTRMQPMPGMTPRDQVHVHLLAAAQVCAAVCTTNPNGYEAGAKALANALERAILDLRAYTEAAAVRAYTQIAPERKPS